AVNQIDANQLRRVLYVERTQQEVVDQAENRRVGPDAEREREHGHGGEAGVLQQLAKSEFQIVHGSWSVVSGQWSLSVAGQISKPQTPNHKSQRNPKPQIPKLAAGSPLGALDLELL